MFEAEKKGSGSNQFFTRSAKVRQEHTVVGYRGCGGFARHDVGDTFTYTEVFVEGRAQGGDSTKYFIDLQYVTLKVLFVMLGVRPARSPSETPLDFARDSGLNL